MSDIAIQVENIGKRYRLGVQAERKDTLGATAVSWLRSPLGNYRRLRSLSHFDDEETGDDVLWALKDVSFEVKQGEVLGIIGRNGAGKSTLLKILSRITPPTTGKIVLNGRVASLLEVGTGFHPELTGRENVYLNGTILGMTKTEVDRKFDEIVDFSGIEKFIDTPVKRYSSGMNVRLAFSVAAHLEPEILLIDEVLAVGDVEFQKKSLGKMDEISKGGRTVLFVSHNMGAVRNLCNSAIFMKNGKIHLLSTTDNAIKSYVSNSIDHEETVNPIALSQSSRAKGSGDVVIYSLSLLDEKNQLVQEFSIWEPISLSFSIQNLSNIRQEISAWFAIVDTKGEIIGTTIQYDNPQKMPAIESSGKLFIVASLQDNILPPGEYMIHAGILGKQKEVLDWHESVLSFIVKDNFANGVHYDNRIGRFPLRANWRQTTCAQ